MKKKISYICLLILICFGFFSCNVGLGEAVDLEAPEVKLLSHKSNDYVASNFTLKGKVTDNETISKLTIDFEEADIHYILDKNGVWKKKTSKNGDWEELQPSEATVTASKNSWDWTVAVSSADAIDGTGNTYNFTILATDDVGNTSSASKIDCSLVVDEEIPSVSVIRPELDLGYESLKTESESYKLQDGNIVAKLFNGTIKLEGRQDDASSFKELRIEFDSVSNGTYDSEEVNSNDDTSNLKSTEEISENYQFGREKLYYSKTLRNGENGITDLRTWTLSVPQVDWISDSLNSELKSGKHIIRVVSTSISNSDSWERKVLGYFVWYPEADKPWTIIYSGTEDYASIADSSIYPSSKIYGLSQDDDGIKTIEYKFSKYQNSNWNEYQTGNLTLLEKDAKSSQWAIDVPSEIGEYKLEIKVTDIYGEKIEDTRYYKVLDVQPPKIQLTFPAENGSPSLTSNGKIKFEGAIIDDGKISSCKIVYLNPQELTPDNKITYLNGTNSVWNYVTPDNQKGANKNIIFDLPLGSGTQIDGNNFEYKFSKEFDIFTDLYIGSGNQLSTQEFIIQVKDNGGLASVLLVSLTGDVENPKLSIDSIALYNKKSGTKLSEYQFESGVPNLDVLDPNNYIVLEGKWNDNSTDLWENKTKINKINLKWGNHSLEVTPKSDGTWEAGFTHTSEKPLLSGVIQAELLDFAGNATLVTKPVFIEKERARLNSIGADTPNGKYSNGKEILLTLNFTKNVDYTGSEENLKLKLNNNGFATYKEGKGTSKYIFSYIVESGKNQDIDNLDVSEIIFTDKAWKDVKTNTTFDVEKKPNEKIPNDIKTLKSRDIDIDTISPTIDSVKVTSNAGDYSVGSSIYFKITFSEEVSVENPENLKIQFAHKNGENYVESNSSENGGTTMILPYVVKFGDNVATLSLKSILHNDVTVKDVAGNILSNWNLPTTNPGKTITIDTTSPNTPIVQTYVDGEESDGEFIYEEGKNVTFTVSGTETGATVEYSTNNGNVWKKYTGKVTISSNGNYEIIARQTDKAGNGSKNSSSKKFIIDRGALVTRISSTTSNGTYSNNTATNKINGFIEFRKDVTISKGAYVILNVTNNGSYEKVLLTECDGKDGTGRKFNFTYEIAEGDKIADNDVLLDVISFSFDTVKVDDKDISVRFPQSSFKTNKQIRILTGKSTVDSVALENQKLNITFDREISSINTDEFVTLTLPEENFYIPTVLTETEFNDTKAKIPDLGDYYKPGTNGATKDGDYLKPDVSTKYILDFAKDNNDPTVKKLFTDAELNIVKIPLYSSAVSKEGKVLSIELTGEYKLPVKGADYEIKIPEGAIKDKVNNPNAEKSSTQTSSGIEKPEIRIQKSGYTITGAGNTKNAKADYSDVHTAKVKISCRTPGVTLKYKTNSNKGSTETKINSVAYKNTETDDVTVPTSLNSGTKAQKVETTIGTNNATSFDSIKGEKVAIWAQSVKGTITEDSYEYAAKTVLKFEISSNAYDDGQGSNKDTTISENGTVLKTQELQIWVNGGDNIAGANTSETFPLSWSDPSKFKLMARDGNRTGTNVRGNWYWITWDITVDTYHGFVAGNVPANALESGPSTWYAGECSWAAWKTYYVLHPGETLRMQIASGHNNGGCGNYFFRIRDTNELPFKTVDLSKTSTGTNSFRINFDEIDISKYNKLVVSFITKKDGEEETVRNNKICLIINGESKEISNVGTGEVTIDINQKGLCTGFSIEKPSWDNDNVEYIINKIEFTKL